MVWTERLKMLVDMLGVCYFTSAWLGPLSLVFDDYCQLYSEATGDRKSTETLLSIAEKAINVEKAFNTLHAGFTREDDYPPSRLLAEPIKSGPFKGSLIDKRKWNQMLEEYYELHGWDKSTGLQTLGRLQELGLERVANRLAEKGWLTG